jgi:hypothetical protein
MTDVNEIQGGEYELLALSWDETTSKPGEPFTYVRHYQGETVTLSEEDARRLVPVGAVAQKGAREQAELEAARARYLAALAQVPDEFRQLSGLETDPTKAVTSVEDVQPAPEDLTVQTADGFPNPGPEPRIAEAAVGEGTGGPENGEGSNTEGSEPSTVTTAKRTTRSR